MFPSNFVSSDLNVKLEAEYGASAEEEEATSSNAVTFSENVDVKEINSHEPVLAVNEVITYIN